MIGEKSRGRPIDIWVGKFKKAAYRRGETREIKMCASRGGARKPGRWHKKRGMVGSPSERPSTVCQRVGQHAPTCDRADQFGGGIVS